MVNAIHHFGVRDRQEQSAASVFCSLSFLEHFAKVSWDITNEKLFFFVIERKEVPFRSESNVYNT